MISSPIGTAKLIRNRILSAQFFKQRSHNDADPIAKITATISFINIEINLLVS